MKITEMPLLDDEFRNATHCQTRLVNGSVTVVDERGLPILAELRMRALAH